ncbi:NAD(P)H-hydrate dehydratase, partial [Verrucomicrobiota bacterium]
ASDLGPLFLRRPRRSHKGSYGHVLMIGGASGYSGAIGMAARAATRSGAGLVTAVVPQGIVPVVSGTVPEAMIHGAAETEIGSVASDCWPVWRDRLDEFSALLVGPGMTRHNETRNLVTQILSDCTVPVVIDADALNVFEGRLDDLGRCCRSECPLVMTPHPGEMGRLTGRSTDEVQADRFAVARDVAEKTGAVVILKGWGTVVAEQGQTLNVNMTGNPGMATGGMGDVLAGLLAGLLAQGLKPFDAARAAVYLHGRAGDEAAWETTESCLTAGDVIDSIPYAFRHVTMR